MKSLEQQAEETGLSKEFLGDERRMNALVKDSLFDIACFVGGSLFLPFSISMAAQKAPENTIEMLVYAGFAGVSAGTLSLGFWNLGKGVAYSVLSVVKKDMNIFQEYLKKKYPRPELLQEVEYGSR